MIEKIRNLEEIVYINPYLKKSEDCVHEITTENLKQAKKRVERFAPVIEKLFPEVKNGIIESSLDEIPNMKEEIGCKGTLLLKRDDELPIAGSVKARGGIYEVLYHTEQLALENGIIKNFCDDYNKIVEHRDFFAQYKIQVGSTGNLGMSIGIMSAALGYQAIVHMSNDAVEWKKEKLRKAGAIVKEYEGNYEEAVKQGRVESNQDPYSYFVDDENSKYLFTGYALSIFTLEKQLEKYHIDENNPLYVYLPCGVGGAQGGIAYGIKLVYGDLAHIYFIEPTHACCMTLGLVSQKYNEISVLDLGIDGKTKADGLAVTRCSGFVGKLIEPYLDGCMTIEDHKLFKYLQLLHQSESIFIEPSSCASFIGPINNQQNGVHICWATGGSFVPEDIRKEYLRY